MHVEKFTRSGLANVFGHYDRTNMNFRDNINPLLTHKNYNLAAEIQPLGQYEFLNKRLSEVSYQKRKDVNVLADWCITIPKDFNGDSSKFFKEVFDFFANKYGKENVVSAWVHMDEPGAMPHMHFAFMPIVIDNKRGERLNAKKCITRNDLQSIHKQVQKRLEFAFKDDIGIDSKPIQISILNGATAGVNKSIEQLKVDTLADERQELQDDVDELRQQVTNLKQKRQDLLLDNQYLEQEQQDLSLDIQYLTEQWHSLNDANEDLEYEKRVNTIEVHELEDRLVNMQKIMQDIEHSNLYSKYEQHEAYVWNKKINKYIDDDLER